MVQRLDYWRYSGDPTSEHTVFPIGRPTVTNMMMVQGHGLRSFLQSIHKWSRSKLSDVSHTWHIHSPESIEDRRWTPTHRCTHF